MRECDIELHGGWGPAIAELTPLDYGNTAIAELTPLDYGNTAIAELTLLDGHLSAPDPSGAECHGTHPNGAECGSHFSQWLGINMQLAA